MHTPSHPFTGPLQFEEAYMERIWGGDKMARVLGKDTPKDKTIGESWMIAHHAQHTSVVAHGPLAGQTLGQLIAQDKEALLGSRPRLTRHGQFPLLLKILDAASPLSVQVHPDDAAAIRLNEPDVGKTEMWQVLHGDADSELICGLQPGVDAGQFRAAIEHETVGDLLNRFPAPAGTAVFVPAGTVHAIGSNLLIAEIQQNSDLTYRVYDWGRVGLDGKPRELHIEKACAVTQFEDGHTGATTPLAFKRDGAEIKVLAVCEYFAAAHLSVSGTLCCNINGESFHILLCEFGTLSVACLEQEVHFSPGNAVLIPGSAPDFQIQGTGCLLDYYVPDLQQDIVAPLLAAGHTPAAILALGGCESTNALRGIV